MAKTSGRKKPARKKLKLSKPDASEDGSQLEDHVVNAYRRWKHGRPLDAVLQMRMCDEDRAALDRIASASALSCSEVIRVLIYRECLRHTTEKGKADEKQKGNRGDDSAQVS